MASTTAEVSARPANHLLDEHGIVVDGVTRADIEARISSGDFFWLDLPNLGSEELSWLRDIFHFHPLAIEDAEQFGERPKLEEFDGFTFLVLHGSALDFEDIVFGAANDPGPRMAPRTLDDLSEVHFFVETRYIVTVHRGTCPSLRNMARRMKSGRVAVQNPARLFHLVADTLVDSFFPVLSNLDEGIDSLQDGIIARPRQEQLVQLLQYRSALVGLRKVIGPQRDIFAGLASGITALPGFNEEARPYFRDIYDHLIRLADMVDGYRDLVSGVTDAYLSVTSNQLNVVMKQLTMIATIFLPLSYLTGFFGQNFGFLVRNIGSWETFVGIGLGTEFIAVVTLLWLFKSRGWLGSKA